MKYNLEESFEEEWYKIKKEINRYLCEIIASVSLVVFFLLIRGSVVAFLSSSEIDYNDLMVGFCGSAFSLLFSFLAYLISTIGFPRFLSSLILNACEKKDVKNKMREMLSSLYEVEYHWGRVVKDIGAYPSNTAEGLLSFASAYETGVSGIDDKKIEKIKDILNECINNIVKIDSQGKSGIRYTTQALSMQLLAIKKYENLGFIDISDEQNGFIQNIIDELLKSVDITRGWGYFPFRKYSHESDSSILIVPTLWTLRAINAWRRGSDKRFESVLSSLTNNAYQVGFKPNGEPKYSATALYIILISELRDSEMRKKYCNAWKIAASNLINFHCPETEVEISYYLAYNGKMKANYWIHLSRCLVMEAAICNRNKLTIRQSLWLKKMIDKSLSQVHKYYIVDDLQSIDKETPIYPSFYLIVVLSRFLKE